MKWSVSNPVYSSESVRRSAAEKMGTVKTRVSRYRFRKNGLPNRVFVIFVTRPALMRHG